ncbi:1,4-alpha-glucan branching protein GlgB [Pulveribacter suum]|uniref:1,4-alpha-glucan branching enzyme GlgB n=1 Tax=Pulveribacter suum TaxID=2116657 RepID=A0A2P1NL85_9BURK|nr:1,4-alpha-glucan branching protein GlgB [Pulveribacter suum]AVP57839.1 1,4-alpha-glucan branching enzyme [Pulveribacter suum]
MFPPPATTLQAALYALPGHYRRFEQLGAHATDGGTRFTVWAPNARRVSLIGSFNGWKPQALECMADGSGYWTLHVAQAGHGDLYKYRIEDAQGNLLDKADPYATRSEPPPGNASQIWSLQYAWRDDAWMAARGRRQAMDQPISIYEVHLGSWQRTDDGQFLNYAEIGHRLAAHCQALGFTHVELMPVAEHPFYGSWGYQTGSYFAPTSRYGTPQDLMALVDTLHQHGIGVVFDWVGSHFPADAHALARFDGTALYEHEDPRRGFHPQWNSLIFNYGRFEVRDFLISNVLFWLEHYHFDAVRVDAVSSMLYLDFSREAGQWLPNQDGGNQNWEAVGFLQDLNRAVYAAYPDVHVIAEESTAWEGVSRPAHHGGLGFGMKWNMGWMNDTLRYMQRPHAYRRWHAGDIRFSSVYAFDENFVLALSHDEVVYGKGSLLDRQPGDRWQRFAGLRLLYGYMWMHPGKKLLFMGGEFGQEREWHHERALDWQLWQEPLHAGVARWVADLNHALREHPALHLWDFDARGFEWAPAEGESPVVLAFLRRSPGECLLAVCNLTPEPVAALRVGLPASGRWHEILNSDAAVYGGSGIGNLGGVDAQNHPLAQMPASALLTLPPLATVVLRHGGEPSLQP